MRRTNLLLAGLVAFVLLAVPAAVEAQSECGEYISGGPDNPITGALIGSQLRTVTTTVSLGGNAGVSGGGSSVGGNAGSSRTTTVSFYVGFYRMSDGEIYEVRCDNYSLF